MYVIEQFGPERVMLESDFPIDRASFSYRAIWNAHKRITSEFSPDERAQMFAENAQRIYHLDLAPAEVAHAVARPGTSIERFPL
jgi:predicted TIM-barrel fold metal-dependent hydrolase